MAADGLAGLASQARSLLTPLESEAATRRVSGWDVLPVALPELSPILRQLEQLAVAGVPPGSDALEQAAGPLLAAVQSLVSLPPTPGVAHSIVESFLSDLGEGLLIEYLGRHAPKAWAFVRLLGGTATNPRSAINAAGIAYRPSHNALVVDWQALANGLTDPLATVSTLSAEPAMDLLEEPLRDLFRALGASAFVSRPNPTDPRAVVGRWALLGADNAAVGLLLGLGLFDAPGLTPPLGVTIVPAGGANLRVGGSRFSATASAPLSITAAGISGTTPQVNLYAELALPGSPAFAIGPAAGTNLTVQGLSALLRLTAGGGDPLHFEAGARVEGFTVAIRGGEGDGFMALVLPAEPVEITVDIALTWSPAEGLRFRGHGSLEYRDLTPHELGPITLSSVMVRALVDDRGLRAMAAVSAGISLGPIRGSVTDIGLALTVDGTSPLPVLRFKPPTGLGLAIDTAAVSGTGFLLCDPDAGQYAGFLALRIADVVTIAALGLLTTHMPDGSDGFSLLIILKAQFPPIPLGFGFSLSGLGGMVGIHRRMDTVALRDAARAGTVGAILSPADAQGDPGGVVTRVGAIFPVAPGRHLFGPMVTLGWGPNNLVSFDLAIVLELPAPLVLVVIGTVRADLPTKDQAVVQLRLDAVGILDFGAGEVSLDATLVDSRIAAFSISGDLALRAGWKEQQGFALALGGFHPQFAPPPGFPELRRITLALATSDNPAIRIETYLALTSNTIQLGGRLDVRAEAGPFSGAAWCSLDALVQLSPFHLLVMLDAGIEIRMWGTPLLCARLLAALSGPAPWRVAGSVEFEVLLVKGRLAIDVTIGDDAPPPPPPVLLPPILHAALAADDAWSAEHATPPGVMLASGPNTPTLLLHPHATVTVRQRILPIGVPITRFGAARPAAPVTFSNLTLRVATQGASTAVTDGFAAGQFQDLPDAEALSSPGFQQLPSGAALQAATGSVLGPTATATDPFEDVILGPESAAIPAFTWTGSATDGIAGTQGLLASLAAHTPAPIVRLEPELFCAAPVGTLGGAGAEGPHAIVASKMPRGHRVLARSEVLA